MNENERKRAKNYYDRVQYEENNRQNNTPELFENIIEVFNPVKDITKSLIAAAIKDLRIQNETLQETWNLNKMSSFSKKICKEMYLEEIVFVEVIKNVEEKIKYILHNVDNVEYQEQFGEIIHFKIEGEQTFYNEKGEEETRVFTREYKKLENGNVKQIEIIDNQVFEKPFILDRIPVVKFKNDSNIIEALNIIDRINENEAFIRHIFSIHGDPILQAGNIKEFANSDGDNEKKRKNAEVLEKARYKNKRIINTAPADKEAFFKYIELTNPLVPEMQNDIERLEKRLSNLFPEFLLVDTKTQNVSQETYTLKNNGLRTKILSFRTDFLKGLIDVDNSALELMGKTPDVSEDSYTYLDPFEESERLARLNTIDKMADVIEKLKNIDEEMKLQSIIDGITKEAVEELEGMYD